VERASAALLSDRCRGRRLVGSVLWAPPETSAPENGGAPAGWEKVEVVAYDSTGTQKFPYDVLYLYSESHRVGEADQWESTDFNGALVGELVAPVRARAPSAVAQRSGQNAHAQGVAAARALEALGALDCGSNKTKQLGTTSRATGECSCIYRYILRESCSQFDSLPLTYFLDHQRRCAFRRTRRITKPPSQRRRPSRSARRMSAPRRRSSARGSGGARSSVPRCGRRRATRRPIGRKFA
jgi:hypothetical protein